MPRENSRPSVAVRSKVAAAINTFWALLTALLILAPPNVAAQVPANPYASSAARDVLGYLGDLKNRSENRLLLGQDLGHGGAIVGGHNDYVVDLHNRTGKWAGLIGGDYGLDSNHNVYQTNQILIDHWQQGGLVTLSWHSDNPWSGGTSWDTNNVENLWELLTPGNYAYDNWQNQLREMADALRPLRDAGVVVLWRPLHEMNGDWFWWGQKRWAGHEAAYVALYQNMFNYLTYDQGLNNLLWVYSTGVTWDRSLLNYYPGSGYVDVAGIDVYDDNVDTWNSGRDYQDLRSLGHPLGLTEFGPLISSANGSYDYRRLLNNITDKYPEFVFSHSWHNWANVKIAYADNPYSWELLNDYRVVTRDEINLESGGVTSLSGEVRIRNRWTGKYLLQTANQPGGKTAVWDLDWTAWSQRWNLEPVPGNQNQYRLRCSWGNNYLHSTGENNNAAVVVWNYVDDWYSERWAIEQVDGDIYRIRNLWSNRYLSVSGNQNDVEIYDLNPEWWSQQWVIEYND